MITSKHHLPPPMHAPCHPGVSTKVKRDQCSSARGRLVHNHPTCTFLVTLDHAQSLSEFSRLRIGGVAQNPAGELHTDPNCSSQTDPSRKREKLCPASPTARGAKLGRATAML